MCCSTGPAAWVANGGAATSHAAFMVKGVAFAGLCHLFRSSMVLVDEDRQRLALRAWFGLKGLSRMNDYTTER